MSDIFDLFHRQLDVRVREVMDERMAALAEGGAADYPDYRHRVGYLEALRDVMEICRQLELERYGKLRPGD